MRVCDVHVCSLYLCVVCMHAYPCVCVCVGGGDKGAGEPVDHVVLVAVVGCW